MPKKTASTQEQPTKPSLNDKQKLQVRTLQVNLIQYQQRLNEARNALDAITSQMRTLVEGSVTEQGFDVNEWVFNIDTLDYVEKAKATGQAANAGQVPAAPVN